MLYCASVLIHINSSYITTMWKKPGSVPINGGIIIILDLFNVWHGHLKNAADDWNGRDCDCYNIYQVVKDVQHKNTKAFACASVL